MNRLALIVSMYFFMLFSNTSFAQDWKYDIEEAKLFAKETDQNIVLFFTGSDWCAPCIKLEKNIFSSQKFIKFAEKQFVWLKAEFPKRRKNRLSIIQQKKNETLLQGFHLLILLLRPIGLLELLDYSPFELREKRMIVVLHRLV